MPRASRTSSRRVVAGAGLVMTAIALMGCTGNAAREPTVTSVNFSPKLVLEVNDDGFVWRRGPRDDPTVTIPPNNEPPTVYRGTVMEVTNTGRRGHWVDGGKTFDTGEMKPGEKSVVALTEELTEPKKIDITDREAPDHRTSLNLQPRPET